MAWEKSAAAAAAELVAAVNDSQSVHLRGIKQDPRAMWETLELVHRSGKAKNNSLSTWNEFHITQYTNYSIPLKAHIGGILEISNRLRDLFPDPPSNKQIIARILSSLPRDFDQAVNAISDHSNRDDRNYVVGRILRGKFTICRNGGLAVTFPGQTSALATTITIEPVVCSNCCRGHSLEQCFHKGGPLEGNIPNWFLKHHQTPQANFTHVFAL
ncbi:hypothetical protein DFH07DRAFT_961303 [Mycena maculata]|uniref:Uncharacterized protein n=1 Tax=Mycena maculata TaxID=230809 RepID=A0AAD7IUH1_9AGAR|nr:hypothetical protein DFH07DRAFT_961303 [Mycena maculata]